MKKNHLVGLHGYQKTFDEQNITAEVSHLGGSWGAFNFLRPSRWKKIAPVVGGAAMFIPAVGPVVGSTILATGAAAGVAHETYRGNEKPSNAYDAPNNPVYIQQPQQQKQEIPWTPIAIGGAALAAIIALK